MFQKAILIATLLLSGLQASATDKFVPYGEGMPAPWPFPWAKECPTKWASLNGRYAMYDSQANEEIDLKISVLAKGGLKLMRMSRFNSSGIMISDGMTVVTENQKSIRVRLRPVNGASSAIWASLKLYYDQDFSCDISHLVPILTFVERSEYYTTEVQYRLVRRPISE